MADEKVEQQPVVEEPVVEPEEVAAVEAAARAAEEQAKEAEARVARVLAATQKPTGKYVVAADGVSWGVDGRAEKGEPYGGPQDSIPWLVEQGAIREVA